MAMQEAGSPSLQPSAAATVSIPVSDPAVAALPLVFHQDSATIDRDPQALAARLAQHYPLLDFGPRQGWERAFLHRSSSAAAGDLILTCGYTSPIAGLIGEQSGIGSINICFAGLARYEVEGRTLEITPSKPIFFAPNHSYRYVVDHFNGMAFHVDLQRLRSTAAAMAGFGISERRFNPDLRTARVVGTPSERTSRLLALLRQAFGLVDDSQLESAGVLAHLPIDDLIHRLLALLLFPRLAVLLEEEGAQGPSSRGRIFEELLEWIQANLGRSIPLSELEQRSGYSRRHLQAAFQQRFGCGPIQWIRRQRLEQARMALLQPSAAETVTAIASRFGFRNLAVFSRDFNAAYGLRPSDLLREGRRHIE